jgi:hypothetical protein
MTQIKSFNGERIPPRAASVFFFHALTHVPADDQSLRGACASGLEGAIVSQKCRGKEQADESLFERGVLKQGGCQPRLQVPPT